MVIHKEGRGRPKKQKRLRSEYSKKFGFEININLGKNLMRYRNAVLNQDFDFCMIIDGKEGVGKSCLGFQIAYILDVDNDINVDKQLCYTPEQVTEAISTLKPGKAVIFDEAMRGSYNRRSMQETNISLNEMLAECRQKQLFLIFILPNFYWIDRYVATHRSRALIHVYAKMDADPKNPLPLKRGFFEYYNERGKNELYNNDFYRRRSMYPPLKNSWFQGNFPHYWVVNHEKYKDAKTRASEDWKKKKQPLFKCPQCSGKAERRLTDGNYKCRLGHVWGVEEE